MAQAVTGHGLLPKAISVHAKRSSYYRPGPQRANPASQSRFVLCSSTQNKSTEVSDHGEEPVRPQHEERFVSVSDLLAEVKCATSTDRCHHSVIWMISLNALLPILLSGLFCT